jgi:hypothetical protein
MCGVAAFLGGVHDADVRVKRLQPVHHPLQETGNNRQISVKTPSHGGLEVAVVAERHLEEAPHHGGIRLPPRLLKRGK